jgi:hypothetical protein
MRNWKLHSIQDIERSHHSSLRTQREMFYKDMAMAPHDTANAAKVVPTVIAL